VEIDVVPEAGGATIVMKETPISGPLAKLPQLLVAPLLRLRNALSLQRLRHEVERS